jgi:hypothetical protein
MGAPLLWTVPTPFDPAFLSRNYDPTLHELYFAYGSNLNAARMLSRDVKFVERGMSARLMGYQLVFNKIPVGSVMQRGGKGWANLVPCAADGAAAYGIVYIVHKCNDDRRGGLFHLDRYEGVEDRHYSRKQVWSSYAHRQ